MTNICWQDLRGFDKDMREWNAFVGLESTVKNMMTRCEEGFNDQRADQDGDKDDKDEDDGDDAMNDISSLRAVGELQNNAIRERHWLQLVQATKVDSSHPFIEMKARSLKISSCIITLVL